MFDLSERELGRVFDLSERELGRVFDLRKSLVVCSTL